MSQILLRNSTNGEIKIGNICEIQLTGFANEIDTRAFLAYQNIHYLKQIADWSANRELRVFPESPGMYTLIIQWRDTTTGIQGWMQQPFKVVANVRDSNAPFEVSVGENIALWAPSEWEAQQLHGYERSIAELLPGIVRTGNVIYDIGANLGQYAVRFSRLVGKTGQVYCIEANPVCIYFLQANLQLNKATNCEILPVALSDQDGSIEFTITYGNSALGISQGSSFYNVKIGHEVGIQSFSLDHLIATLDLKQPSLLKIDIEGAEDTAIAGMERTLSNHHPQIILEIHGKGSASRTFPLLDKFHYRFVELSSHREFSDSGNLLQSFPDQVMQFHCF
jgi:FkbM family methyltransferase